MGKKMVVITPTADRPQGIAHLSEYIQRQTLQPELWIIVDDGLTPCTTPKLPYCQHVTLKRKYEGAKSLAHNILTGLELARGATQIAICEDDDWYAPNHLATALLHLNNSPATGCRFLQYYHVPSRTYRKMTNRGAALCQTALNSDAIPTLKDAAEYALRTGDKGIDGYFWNLMIQTGLHHQQTVIGLKGIGGREGIGIGHRPDKRWIPDPFGVVLRDWIGDDTERYL